MPSQILPPPAVCVLDTDDATCEDLERLLADIDDSLIVRTFTSTDALLAAFSGDAYREEMEPCTLVTDRVGTMPGGGTSVVDQLRPKFPLMSIVLYSGIESVKAADLLLDRRISSFVPKPQLPALKGEVALAFERYWNQLGLRIMRNYIERSDESPAPFYEAEDGRWLTIVDVYWEIVRDTPLGRKLRKLWDRLVAQRCST